MASSVSLYLSSVTFFVIGILVLIKNSLFIGAHDCLKKSALIVIIYYGCSTRESSLSKSSYCVIFIVYAFLCICILKFYESSKSIIVILCSLSVRIYDRSLFIIRAILIANSLSVRICYRYCSSYDI